MDILFKFQLIRAIHDHFSDPPQLFSNKVLDEVVNRIYWTLRAVQFRIFFKLEGWFFKRTLSISLEIVLKFLNSSQILGYVKLLFFVGTSTFSYAYQKLDVIVVYECILGKGHFMSGSCSNSRLKIICFLPKFAQKMVFFKQKLMIFLYLDVCFGIVSSKLLQFPQSQI